MANLKTLLKGSVISASIFCVAMASAHDTHSHAAKHVSALDKAIAGEYRSDKNKSRDMYRNPKETLEFFGFKPTMTVVEVAPGGAWYSEILAPALKDKGTFYGAQYPDTGEDNYYSKSRKRLEQKLTSNEIFSKMKLTDFTPKKPSALAPKGSADLVLTFRNLHNWKEEGVKQLFKDAYVALKPDGALGVVEHRMPESQDWASNQKSGYFPISLTIQLAKEAGFKLAASSEINANKKDTANHPNGVWTLPPVLALKDKDRAKYMAIGESDRMTLKFVKAGAKL
ncbi:methyltransferase [Pseudoalteromonas sp. NBT06-2]|uniref:class I SAM-dependent methyltransferase n=1 Tax=Pseudoalteromonas sp. NBT06-2 TaxID=2025950 RepID=UPI000BA5C8D2|nr:class I SAM-dependent methyltransferase [Pseudoalteromonas sp. NBT06-2]PAJ74513.1 methyltransferase [Pseudoalteromonas sp. NBT06-2]